MEFLVDSIWNNLWKVKTSLIVETLIRACGGERSTAINDAHSKACTEVSNLGGDFAAIIASLEEKTWLHYPKLDEDQIVTGIW